MTLQPARELRGIERLTRGAYDLERWFQAQAGCRWLHVTGEPEVHEMYPGLAVQSEVLARAVSGMKQPVRFEDAQIYSARMQFAYALSELPYVTEAWSATAEGVTFIWVFIDEDTTHARRQVFDAEQQVMDKFPHREFDFYVFSSRCRDASVDEAREAEQFYVRS